MRASVRAGLAVAVLAVGSPGISWADPVGRPAAPGPAAELEVRQFHDLDADGTWDPEEPELFGGRAWLLGPRRRPAVLTLPAAIRLAPPRGPWRVVLEEPTHFGVTARILDGRALEPASPAVDAAEGAAAGGRHRVVFGTVELGRGIACKVFDRDGDGEADPGEPLVEGWRLRLSADGRAPVVAVTGEDGCARFSGVLPGVWQLDELVPPSWEASGLPPTALEILSRLSRTAPQAPPLLASRCIHFARMGSPDYWRSRSGLQLLDAGDRTALNALAPFASPSGRHAAWEEPFDGLRADGRLRVAPAFPGSRAWGEGRWEAELAAFLGDEALRSAPRGALATELAALVLNDRHFLERARVVWLEGLPVLVDDLVLEGVLAWHSGDEAWQASAAGLLGWVNGLDGIAFVPRDHCPVAYLPF